MDDNNPNVTQIIHNSLNSMDNNPYPFPEKPLLIHNITQLRPCLQGGRVTLLPG